jgi:hypothetical protein
MGPIQFSRLPVASVSPSPASQDFAAVVTGMFSFYAISFDAKRVDLVEHSLEKQFGRRRRNAGALEGQDVFSLLRHLAAHAFNLTPDEVDIRHAEPRWERWRNRTKHEHEVARLPFDIAARSKNAKSAIL